MRSQICCAEQLLLFNQNVFEISSVGRSTYTYEIVNCVNVYGRDVTLDFQTNLVEFIYARISVVHFGGKQERCAFTMSFCALIYRVSQKNRNPHKLCKHYIFIWVANK